MRMKTTPRSTKLHPLQRPELRGNALEEMLFNLLATEACDGLIHKSETDDLPRIFGRNASCLEVKNLFITDLPRGRTVRAFDLVGIDFEAWHRVGFGLVASEKVATGLV